MNQIQKQNQEPTLPQKLRDGHQPEAGDIYLNKTYTDRQSVIRLEKKINDHYWEVKQYSFTDEDFTEEYYNLSENDLKGGHYRLLLHPLQDILNSADRLFQGFMPEESPLSDSTELMRSGKERLLAMRDEAQMKADAMESVKIVMQARINSIRSQMEEKMEQLEPVMKALQKQSEIISQVLSWLHAYLGKDVEAQTVVSGEGAAKDEPLCIRQRILYMDEEVAVVGRDGQGLDYTGKDTFYEWIKEPKNRDIILPEQRCAVVMKPKRYSHHYTNDHFRNRIINEMNRHSFIMIRDGENVHAIESNDLEIYGTAIPTKAQYESIRNDRFNDEYHAEQETRRLQSRTMFYMMLLQGLADNTEILGVHRGINISKETGVKIILDAEQDSMIGSGIKPWKEWLKERQKDIRRGDRIIFAASRGWDGTFYRTYYNEWSKPTPPESGLYSVEEAEDGRLVFKYRPDDKIFNQSEGYYTERRNRVSYVFDRSCAINFDTTSLEELEAYLTDRTQRESYAGIIGLLINMREIKKKEQEMERHFVNLMTADISKDLKRPDNELLRETTEAAVAWWKTKVIFKRPLSEDDAKAWRMIRQKTVKEYCTSKRTRKQKKYEQNEK